MTRKKSNVKALALAVTCAILAGGGIGLEPVYAANVLYKEAGGNVTATGTIKGNTITDGNGFTATGGKITANEGQIGSVKISAAGEVTGVKSIEASTFKVDEENYLNSNGITAKGGKIGGAVIDATTLSVGSTKLDKADGITTNKLKIDGMTLTDTKLASPALLPLRLMVLPLTKVK